MSEIWKPVAEAVGLYEVSSVGRLRSLDRIDEIGRLRRGKVLGHGANETGRRRVALVLEDRTVVRRELAALVLESFVGPRPLGMLALHDDDDPTNNTLPNLYWGTRRQNRLDAVRNGKDAQAGKTQCPRGHLLAAPNLVPSSLKKNRRSCLACQRARSRTSRHPVSDAELRLLSDSYYQALSA